MLNTKVVIEQYCKDNKQRYSEKYINDTRKTCNRFLDFCSKDYYEVTRKDIINWFSQLIDIGRKPSTLCTYLANLKSFYGYCLEEDLVEKDPTKNIITPKKEDSPPYYLNMKELNLLREESKKSVRVRAIVETLYATGVRINELLNIKLYDIDWKNDLKILIKEAKGNKVRYVLFTTQCAEVLKEYLNTRKDSCPYLFVNKYDKRISAYSSVQWMFDKYSEALGFKVTPHVLRHTLGAHLAMKGMPIDYIQSLLGHDDIKNTKIYTELFEEARKQEYEKLN